MKIQNIIFSNPKKISIERKACVLIPDIFFLNKLRLPTEKKMLRNYV